MFETFEVAKLQLPHTNRRGWRRRRILQCASHITCGHEKSAVAIKVECASRLIVSFWGAAVYADAVVDAR